MTLLPSLTTTRKDLIGSFLEDLRTSEVRTIALFPTTLKPEERRALYRSLEAIPGLKVPHVHLRSDSTDAEVGYLMERFGAEVFNVHPRASQTAYVGESRRWNPLVYLENADALPEADQLKDFGGVCPDFSHWEAARRVRDRSYAGFEDLVRQFPAGCCHISAIRDGAPNPWNGRADHHSFTDLGDLDYVAAYREFFPPEWLSLELENPLADQLAVKARLERLLGL